MKQLKRKTLFPAFALSVLASLSGADAQAARGWQCVAQGGVGWSVKREVAYTQAYSQCLAKNCRGTGQCLCFVNCYRK